MKFVKMHGLGNDFVIIENLLGNIKEKQELARKLCDRHFGIGADGLIFVESSNKCDARMSIINSDGSIAEMCGNGIRCFCRYLYDYKIIKRQEILVETLSGLIKCKVNTKDGEFKSAVVNMGKPSFKKEDIPFNSPLDNRNYEINIKGKVFKASTLLMGVPHTIIFRDKIIEEEVLYFGELIGKLNIYPKGTNVNFVRIIDNNNIEAATFERGAGRTLACGTGSCASAIAGINLGLLKNPVNVNLFAGILKVNYSDGFVYMEGPAVKVFEGVY